MTAPPTSRAERTPTVLPFGYAPDWAAVAARGRAVAGDAVGAPGVSAVETEREQLVVAFGLFLAGDSPGRSAATVRIARRQLATLAGLREDRAGRALARLAEAGVVCDPDGAPLVVADDAPAWDDQIVARLADDVLRPAPASRAVRWDAVRARAGGSARALAATAAFFDLVPVPTEWTSVSLAAVGEIARYTGRKVGEAVQRAVECGVIEERRERGSANLYRFAGGVLHDAGIAARSAPPAPSPAPPASPTRASPTTPASPTSPSGAAGFRAVAATATLMIGGVAFPIPPGARPRLEQDADGQYWYRIGSMHLGPVSLG